MPFICPEISCNLQWRNQTRQLAYAKQGEYNSRKIAVQLYNGANRFTFTPGTYAGEFAYKRPDGAGRAYSTIDDAAAVELDGTTGTAVITLEPEVLGVAGIVECELRLKTSGSLLATFTFGYYVEQAVVTADTPSPSPDPSPTPTPTGEKTKFFGFETLTAYNQFVAQNPGVLVDGDIVVIRSVNGSDIVHTFYVLVGTQLTSRHVITVGSGSGGASSLPALGGGYGVCSSLKTTVAKIVRIDGFVRTQNVPFQVKFNYDVQSGDTLNVRSSSSSSSGTGACTLRWNGDNVPTGLIVAGCMATLVYDGTYYQVLSVDPVTAPMIADGAVTSDKIADGAITSAKLANNIGFILKSAQGNADNYSSALVVAPAGVDSNGAIKSPVAVYGTVTRTGVEGHYFYSANIFAGLLYQIQQVYPHMRAFLVDHEGRECTLIKPPASDQDSLVFYTLDKTAGKVVFYTVDTGGTVTIDQVSIDGGVVPAPGVGDEGKVPMVVNGVVVWAAIPETTTSEIDAIIAAI
jgi:hypothetical protein